METLITFLAFLGGCSVLKAIYEGLSEWKNRDK